MCRYTGRTGIDGERQEKKRKRSERRESREVKVCQFIAQTAKKMSFLFSERNPSWCLQRLVGLFMSLSLSVSLARTRAWFKGVQSKSKEKREMERADRHFRCSRLIRYIMHQWVRFTEAEGASERRWRKSKSNVKARRKFYPRDRTIEEIHSIPAPPPEKRNCSNSVIAIELPYRVVSRYTLARARASFQIASTKVGCAHGAAHNALTVWKLRALGWQPET